ncbi:hypothetical protein HMPREF3193_00488 [Bifidobacterium breve]|jgi:hypothetical protein|nr:hypothetical protein HMPREF1587_01686 [Bifidobacterium breve JCP7499]KOA37271.1 hypothetical protein BBM0476_08270 [Bifidobacterium breve MCC 0476]KOA43930.1 hypothetical protein BBM0121_06260 [Bifidobacterium breve MCC 0121]KOA51995.1 hypothetical protein BBM1340_03275 [Bifidobacterium breve MCC 1340]KWZ86307.1 hypothetical protein HMPREF3193_00488 [Bifidobacterium breve]
MESQADISQTMTAMQGSIAQSLIELDEDRTRMPQFGKKQGGETPC